MEAKLKELKEKRKSLKSKITRTANALKHAVNDKSPSTAKAHHESLSDQFSTQFMNLHYDYVEALDEASEEAEPGFDLTPYKVVNGMSCQQYLDAVKSIFSDASACYQDYLETCEFQELSSIVDLPIQLAGQAISSLQEYVGNDKSTLSSDEIVAKAEQCIDDLKTHFSHCREASVRNDRCKALTSKLSSHIVELSQGVSLVTGLAQSKRSVSQSIHQPSYTTSSPNQHDSRTQGPLTGSELRPTLNSSRYKRPNPPKFSGNRREWPEFKAVWENYAAVYYDNDLERSHALKETLSGNPLDHVRPILSSNPGAYSEIWDRLVDIYDDVSLSVQSVFNDFKQLKPVKECDPNGLVKLINDIEMGYSQLKQIGNIECVTMIQVDEVCECLPPNIRELWEEKYHSLSKEEKLHPFNAFMDFLNVKRSINIRRAEKPQIIPQSSSNQSGQAKSTKTFHSAVESTESSSEQRRQQRDDIRCVIHHDQGSACDHNTQQCSDFTKLSLDDKTKALRDHNACFRCFSTLHHRKWCKEKKPCEHCSMRNHHSLLCRNHFTHQASTATSLQCNVANSSQCVLPITNVAADRQQMITAFFDDGSDATYITHEAAKRLGAKCKSPITLDIVGIGGTTSRSESYIYEFNLFTDNNECKTVYGYGMDSITGPVSAINYGVVAELFPHVNVESVKRGNSVDVLVGADYYGYHPKQEMYKSGEHLSIMRGVFGLCLVGHHPSLRDMTTYSDRMAKVMTHHGKCQVSMPQSLQAPCHIRDQCSNTSQGVSTLLCSAKTVVHDFIQGENLGTEISPRCGSCKCGKCPILGYNYSFEEEQQLQMIRDNLTYDPERKIWTTDYPWIQDPSDLPDNYSSALATLKATEKTLRKDTQWATTYHEQIMDMVQRGVARKLSANEVQEWRGPQFYISHLAVSNPKSKTTPVRIVFNSSQKHKGKSLNSFLAKGPDAYLNNLIGVLLRWREQQQAVTADIRKMYNSVYINEIEQHCHRFLWRNLDDTIQPDIYVIQRVNMGDKPAGAIASEAIYKTASMFKEKFPKVAKLLMEDTFVDDICSSVSSKEEAIELASDTNQVLGEAGFRVKSWLFSGEQTPRVDPNVPPVEQVDLEPEHTRVLGVVWDPKVDVISFIPSLNFSSKRKGVYIQDNLREVDIPKAIPNQLTRRIVLEQTMKLYDPFGFLSPFTLLAKVLLRETWTSKLSWDETLPEILRDKWVQFFEDLFDIAKLKFDRCMKPDNSVGAPILVILSDGSDIAYGSVAFIRWQCNDGSVWCRQIMSKCRIAPLNKLSTPQMELNGAVMSKRIRSVIEKECRYQFDKVVQLVDSETVLAMISKCSTRFKVYEGVRVGEVQAATHGDMSEWKWICGDQNTADWLTRGRKPLELGKQSEWWIGPQFMYEPLDQWPVKSVEELNIHSSSDIPGLKKCVNVTETAVHSPLVNYSTFSSARNVHWAVARAYSILRAKSFRCKVALTAVGYSEARKSVLKDVQATITNELMKGAKGQYRRLSPQFNETEGVWVVGKRLGSANPLSVDGTNQALLPSNHPYTRLLMRDAHVAGGHRGRDSTLARFRLSYWTPQGSKIAQSVCNQCQHCKLVKPRMLKYSIAQLPEARLKANPPFSHVMLDLFGPYVVKGEVQRRTSGKAYGVLFTDLYSRAVHVEVVPGYDSESFKEALVRYASVRGWPAKIYSDPGSQLVCVEKELKYAWKTMVHTNLYKLSGENGTEWVFGPAASPWYQGAVESMIKNIKSAIKYALGDQRLRYSEFETVCKYAANQVNERPLGTLACTDSEVNILTPNSLLLGRALAHNPGYSIPYTSLSKQRHLVSAVCEAFWKRWCQFYVPTLFSNSKEPKQKSRNLKVGDVVVVTETNPLRQGYFIARVRSTYPSKDGVVRKVGLVYKNIRVGNKVYEYKGSSDVIITRSVKNLALLVAIDDQ